MPRALLTLATMASLPILALTSGAQTQQSAERLGSAAPPPAAAPTPALAPAPASAPAPAAEPPATAPSGGLPLPPPAPALTSMPALAPLPASLPAPAVATAPASEPAVIPAPATEVASAPASEPAAEPTNPSELQTQPASAQQPQELGRRLITADLDRNRDQIAPSLGAVSYTIGPAQIASVPGGENASFQQVLLRAPGVVEDSLGQVHIRGEHANITYRLNGVLLPQPVNVFGQEIDTRLVRSVTLIDGTLPAQFGLHTAAIIDVTTKSGAALNHNEASIYGGSYDTFQPSLQVGGSTGRLDYFITTTYNHNALGIENPTPSHHAIHDYTDQQRLFAYLNYTIDDTSRLSFFVNGYNGDFQIPSQEGLPKMFTLAGQPNANSVATRETQNEEEYYAVVAYQKTVDKLSYQLSGFARYGQITFSPDYGNDLIFQGVASSIYNTFATYGIQLDSSYALDPAHTVRVGLIGDFTAEKLDSSSAVFPVDSSGGQTSTTPFTIVDNSSNEATEAGFYIQDEWRLSPQLTFNYGIRYDLFSANFDNERQFSPRANLVWKIDDATTAHVGYSRYFVPPPVQDVRPASQARFDNTSNASASAGNNPPRVEKSNYYDIGVSRKVSPALQVNLDGFYKEAQQLVDLGQFGSALILSPYNYRGGHVYGVEMSATYNEGGFNAFANFSWVRTMAHDIFTQQFNFAPDELAYIREHNIKLDHESQYTVSAGADYTFLRDNRVYLDMLYGSGLRAGFANTVQEQQYYPVNVGYEHVFRGGYWGPNNVKVRFDVMNLFDQSYQLRQGGGLGINASQYGERRGYFGGMTYEF